MTEKEIRLFIRFLKNEDFYIKYKKFFFDEKIGLDYRRFLFGYNFDKNMTIYGYLRKSKKERAFRCFWWATINHHYVDIFHDLTEKWLNYYKIEY